MNMSGTSTLQNEGQALGAEVARVATNACDAAERTALEAIDAALTAAGLGRPETADRLREIGGRLVERTQMMQTEIGRYLDLGRGGVAQGMTPKG
jgi:hypothetical protein